MLQLSNFSGCIIYPGSLYNGRLKTYITWEASKYIIVYFSQRSPPLKKKNLSSKKKVSNNNSDGALYCVRKFLPLAGTIVHYSLKAMV